MARRPPDPVPRDGGWEPFLAQELRTPVRVVWTRARRMPIQIRSTRAGTRELRMHALFAEAPLEVREAVARWARAGRRASRACEILDRWVAEALARLPPPPLRAGSLKTRGACHDLAEMLRGLLESELRDDFAGWASPPRATWGRPGRSRTRRSLRLGSFDNDTGVARIHPVLDQPAVPDWFVRYVLFHELLHGVHPPVRASGRWVHHGRAFRIRERAYTEYARSLAWEAEHIQALVRSARRGKPIAVRGDGLTAVRGGGSKAGAAARRFLQKLLFPD